VEHRPERPYQERGHDAAAGTGGAQASGESVKAVSVHHSLLKNVAAIGSVVSKGSGLPSRMKGGGKAGGDA
jgi:hypothetical protein